MKDNSIKELEKQLDLVWKEAREKASDIKKKIEELKENTLKLPDLSGHWFVLDIAGDEVSKLVKIKKIEQKADRVYLESSYIELDELGNLYVIHDTTIEGTIIEITDSWFVLDFYGLLKTFTEIPEETAKEQASVMFEESMKKLFKSNELEQ